MGGLKKIILGEITQNPKEKYSIYSNWCGCYLSIV